MVEEKKGLVSEDEERRSQKVVSSLHPIRPIVEEKQRPLNRIGPDITLSAGDEKPLDDERPKRKLVTEN